MVKILIFILKTLSKFPRFFHVGLSEFIYRMIRLFGYRRAVINTNLEIAFPEKTKEEKRKIRIEFYKIFADYVVEFIMLFNIDKSKMVGKYIFEENFELLNKFKEEGCPTFALAGHIFNWEWIALLVDYFPQKYMYAIYKPLKNKELDQYLDQLRFSLGGQGIPMNDAGKKILSHPDNRNAFYYFLVDQSPKLKEKNYSVTFFGKETLAFFGYETLARKINAGVVYVEAEKLGLGKYIYHLKELKPKSESFEKDELVTLFYHELEKSIRRHPSNWLWSHRRWKHQLSN